MSSTCDTQRAHVESTSLGLAEDGRGGKQMSTVIQARLLTAEEFAQLPQPEDGSQQELVNGVVLTMPPPSFYHGLCCNRLGRKLGNFVDDARLGFVTSNDSGVILAREPDTVRGPDLAFWSRDRMPT